jgi:hypothetical protein
MVGKAEMGILLDIQRKMDAYRIETPTDSTSL